MSAMGNSRIAYVPALDGLRAVAVLLVLAFHARTPGVSGGFLGVDVFFVLSGFLITTLLKAEFDDNGRVALRAFYARRIRRLYPALLVMLMAYIAIAPLALPGLNHMRDAILSALYLTNYSQAFYRVPDALGHTWSLATEAQFYLVWPAVMLALLRLRPGPRILALLSILFAAVAWRQSVLTGSGWTAAYYRFDTRISGLCIGSIIAFLPTTRSVVIGYVGLAMIAIAAHLAHWHTDSGLMWLLFLAEIGAAFVILCGQSVSFLRAPLLVWIGKMSYGIYLWHYPIIYWMRKVELQWWIQLALSALLSVIAAALSYYIVEQRFYRPSTYRQQKGRNETPPISRTG